MDEEDIEKNLHDLAYQDWLSFSNILFGAGITGIFAIWPILDSFNIPEFEKLYIVSIISSLFLLVSFFARNKAANQKSKIKEIDLS